MPFLIKGAGDEMGIEGRVGKLEQDGAAMKVQIENLADVTEDLKDATRDNTDAIRELTNTLSYNKGIIVASAKFAGLLTMIIGAAWAAGTWVVSLIHGGPK